jgi:hypothetical protein
VIGVEPDCPFTPAMLKKVAYAGVQLASFVQATGDLEALAEAKVSRERVQRWTKRIGNQRVTQIKEQAEAYQELSLPDRGRSPVDQVPQVAMRCHATDRDLHQQSGQAGLHIGRMADQLLESTVRHTDRGSRCWMLDAGYKLRERDAQRGEGNVKCYLAAGPVRADCGHSQPELYRTPEFGDR